MASQNVCYAQILCEKIMNKKNKKKQWPLRLGI